jgi:hypothetical protein
LCCVVLRCVVLFCFVLFCFVLFCFNNSVNNVQATRVRTGLKDTCEALSRFK